MCPYGASLEKEQGCLFFKKNKCNVVQLQGLQVTVYTAVPSEREWGDEWDWGSTRRALKTKTIAVYDVTEGERANAFNRMMQRARCDQSDGQ